VWGFCERKLLPKRKPDLGGEAPSAEGYFQKMLRRARGEDQPAAAVATSPTAITTGNGGVTPAPSETRARARGKQGRKRRQERGADGLRSRTGAEADADGSPLGRLRTWLRRRRQRLREWWVRVLKQAEKK
jgi:hypothetical protein